MVGRTRKPTFIELFTPKLITVLREGYRLRDLRADAISALGPCCGGPRPMPALRPRTIVPGLPRACPIL